MSRKAKAKPQLTPEILKFLKFRMLSHINGGANFSERTNINDEWGIYLYTRTDGSPNYKVRERLLGVAMNDSIKLDLLDKSAEMQGFCDRFNKWKNTK